MNRYLAGIAFALCAQLNSHAAAPASAPASDFVMLGFNAYAKGDLESAAKLWFDGAPEQIKAQSGKVVALMKDLEGALGKIQSIQIIGEHNLSDRARMVYFVFNYDRGPGFGRFTTYRLGSGNWTSIDFNLHSDPTKVWPTHLSLGTRTTTD